MKHKIPFFLLRALLLSACIDSQTYYVRGTLYSDSTLSTPMVGHDLAFKLDWAEDTLGAVKTDSQGHFGFAFNLAVDPVARQERKTSKEYTRLLIIDQNDTLYCEEYFAVENENLVLYPGCWERRRYWK